MAESSAAAGNIYDLGYRGYEGARLGRSYAIISLFFYSLRAIFGLGRSAWAKVFAFGLAGIAMLPAIAQLAFAAIAPLEVDVVRLENNFGYLEIVLALFCALAAPEIVGRDQRHHTLPLYFSRSLSRADYVAAKFGALVAALFAVLVIPTLLIVLGNAVSEEDVLGYLGDHAGDFPPILGSSLVVALVMGGASLAIASTSSRRAISTVAVLAFFVIFGIIGGVLVETTTGDVQRYSVLLSPLDVLDGVVHWLFSATPQRGSTLAKAELQGVFYTLGAAAYLALAIGYLLRRFSRMSV